jgi:hypothetical protein
VSAKLAFAVAAKPLPRRTQGGPLSAAWTLYDPRELAAKLGLPVETVDLALEQTGFNKAVRIREEVIRWKERLRHEERSLRERLEVLDEDRFRIKTRLSVVNEQLANTRNCLRISRQKPEAT